MVDVMFLPDDEVIVRERFKALCCEKVFSQGDNLVVLRQTSPNRVMVSLGNNCHKVKRSTLNRCGERKLT